MTSQLGWRSGYPRCDTCDNGIMPDWKFCPLCGAPTNLGEQSDEPPMIDAHEYNSLIARLQSLSLSHRVAPNSRRLIIDAYQRMMTARDATPPSHLWAEWRQRRMAEAEAEARHLLKLWSA